jgi:hypothetical protein
MHLDPSKSLALFVSGLGSNGSGEAILFVTQRLDGRYYWHGMLLAPTGFTPAPVSLTGPYTVTGMPATGALEIRAGAGLSHPVIGSFPASTNNIMRTPNTTAADGIFWAEVINPSGGTGWVNFSKLTEYITHDAFCGDARVPAMIEQLKTSVNQSNGDIFASLVSNKSGVNVHAWQLTTPINFSTTSATGIFTSTQVYDWGQPEGRGGPDHVLGTFAQIVKPNLLEVFNDPNTVSYCDDLTMVFNGEISWSYTNIRFYHLYRPSTPGNLDFRTWLIGFEYLNGTPRLHSLQYVIWAP